MAPLVVVGGFGRPESSSTPGVGGSSCFGDGWVAAGVYSCQWPLEALGKGVRVAHPPRLFSGYLFANP